MQLDGWTTEDMTLRAAAGIEVTWPRTFQSYTWRLDEHEDSVQDADKTLRQLRTALDDARRLLDRQNGQGPTWLAAARS